MSWVLPPAPPVGVPVEGGGLFPVRRIFCVGRNYADHVAEMGGDSRDLPFFFTKPADAVVQSGAVIPYPPGTHDLHHEAELVIAIGKGGADIADPEAHIFGFAAGNDLTRRDLQAEAKAQRRPWDMSKAFDNSAVMGAIRPGPLGDGLIRLTVDGVERQSSMLSMMIWSVPEIVTYLSSLVTLAPGDLIYTGTPAGVGALQRGQSCVVTIEGLSPASVTIA
ncbi:fumarylacetoacetate hydrolase family protein [Stagnihabitans tardus]|uniref:FAA hydrolase family protein n=1 Tax=Stagnihabitans tardus TaxID=2699202 RepID=A0AAE4Y9M9_9RHOB|nr:fumarylacetoacetate hydrolase family protein [Stagnihabitans tardus]NBZ87248.1 FAA hydrolase family protein [Stagnihabitans tardus]